MTRAVWFNCCAGVAGDMLLASLIDAGADPIAVTDAWASLGAGDWAVAWERVQRCGVGAVWTNLAIDDGRADGRADRHRPAADVIAMIDAADLPRPVRAGAISVYRALAEVEGEIHAIEPDAVELHEVGALDSILDVVGVCAALHSLGVELVTHSPIAVGHGTVATAHGELPNPVPAVSRLLARSRTAIVGLDTTMEVATPTGVALLTVLSAPHRGAGPMPPMTITATGFGAGRLDPQGRPNVVQAVVGELTDDGQGGDTGRPAIVLEVNVDDVSGEVVAHTISALLAAGARDAWATPIVMKKGRPAHSVHALCEEAEAATVRATLLAETGSLGVRATRVERWPQHRTELTVTLDGHAIRIKLGAGRVKVEHDDAAAAARALGRPLRTVIAQAERLADERSV